MKGRLLARRWPAVVLAAVLVATVGGVSHGSSMRLPFTDSPVPLSSLMIVGASIIVVLPLISAMPELEPSLSREVGLRVMRVVLVIGIVGVAMTVGWVAEGKGFIWVLRREVPFSVLLVCVALVAVVVVGDAAWLVPLTLGYLGLVVDSTLTAPITSRLAVAPSGAIFMTLALAGALYVWRGPRLGN